MDISNNDYELSKKDKRSGFIMATLSEDEIFLVCTLSKNM